jgi:hypothetical protein
MLVILETTNLDHFVTKWANVVSNGKYISNYHLKEKMQHATSIFTIIPLYYIYTPCTINED